MPQMSPMNWLILYIMFSLCLFLSAVKISMYKNSVFQATSQEKLASKKFFMII